MKKTVLFSSVALLVLSSASFSQNRYPGFYPIANRGVLVGDTLRFTLSAYDLDGDALTWSASGVPGSASFNTSTQEFYWVPASSDLGLYTVTFSVDDGNGHTVSRDVDIDVRKKGWVTITEDESLGNFMSIYFKNDTLGWVSGYSGVLYKSTTGGALWTAQNSTTTYNLIKIQFVAADTGWAVGQNGTIIYTDDGGANWSMQGSGTTEYLLSGYFMDMDTGYAIGTNGTVIKTTNGGTTWNPLTSGASETLRDITFMDGDTGLIVGYNGIILKTTDNGTNWSSKVSGVTGNLRGVTMYDTSAWAVGDTGTILKSSDYGTNWSPQTSNVEAVLYDVQFVNPDTGYVVGSFGTILKTTNGGISWFAQNCTTGVTLTDVHFLNPDTGWVTGSRVILHTTNGGIDWHLQTGIGSTFEDIVFVDSYNGWISDFNGHVHHTNDGGETWTIQHTDSLFSIENGGITWSTQSSGTTSDLRDVHFTSTTTGWVVGYNGTILHTNDGGSTWTSQTSGTSETISGIYCISSTTAWAVGTNGTILKTIDGGSSWNAQTSGTTEGLSDVHFENSTHGWIIGLNGSTLRTTNGGSNWIINAPVASTYYETIFFADSMNGFATGQNGTIIRTTNGGLRWTLMNTNTSQSIWSIHMFDAHSGWAVGSNQMLLKYENTITLSFSDTTADPGDTVSVSVSVDGIALEDSIMSFEFTLGVDTTELKFAGIDTVGCLASLFEIDSNLVQPDTVKMAGYRTTALSSDGLFIKLKFIVSDTAGALDSFYYDFDEFFFNEGVPLVQSTPGYIIANGPLYGDVSVNGSINSLDASLILQYRVGKTTLNDTALTAAEVSGNGSVTAYDASLIMRYVAGYISAFDVGYMFAPKDAYANFESFLAKISETEEFVDYSVNLKNVKNIYASDITFNVTGLELEKCSNTSTTKNFMVEEYLKDGILNIALAGAEPVSGSVEILKLKFKKLGNNHNIEMEEVIVNETEITVSGEIASLLPDTYDLHQNYPNPFNSETVIKYQLPEAGHVEISIYNLLGQNVRTLVNKETNAGYFTVKWNGRNDAGNTVSSGIYIVTIKAGSFFKTRKMIYLR